MMGTMLAGMPAAVFAQTAAPRRPAPRPGEGAAAPQPGSGVIKSINVDRCPAARAGYGAVVHQAAPGDAFTRETLDQALKDLYASELFADVSIAGAERRPDPRRSARIR
jgi:outer membrane protein insertion porin family